MSASKRARTHADDFADLNDRIAVDFDPEDDSVGQDSDDSGSHLGVDAGDVGREHYEAVGAGKLRQAKGSASLGPQYKGSRISRRDALGADADDSEDPFDAYGSDEASDAPSLEDRLEDDGQDGFDSLDDDGTDVTSVSDDAEDHTLQEDREELKRLMAQQQKNATAAVSEATRTDGEKGRAIQKQRQTFDGLLNTRVRLQHALIATNTLPTLDSSQASEDEAASAIQTAEEALGRLMETLDQLRASLSELTTGSKRKRLQFDPGMSSAALWSQLEQGEKDQNKTRRQVLQKWSRKTDVGADTRPAVGKLDQSASKHGIVDILDEQLVNREKLVRRTRMARSSAPVQARNRVDESKDIFDDADFYGLLLKELLEQRSAELQGKEHADAVAQHWKAAREARTRKNADTKASKGRKMRFTVHEKLQNFMVPEDRGTWGQRQVDELFGSLFGQKLTVNGAHTGSGEVEDGVESDQEEALKLFRS